MKIARCWSWPGVFALALTSSCTADTDMNTGDETVDCAAELIGDWESSNEFGCPLVDPNCTYRHTLSFDGEDYEWNPDQSFEGPYTCEDGVVEATDFAGAVVFTATYDVEADALELSWEGLDAPEPYRRAAP